MICVRIKAKSEMACGTPVRVMDVAYVLSDARVDAANLSIPMPRETGIWLVDAGAIISAIYKSYPGETVKLLGDSIGWLRRRPEANIQAHGREWLRSACASIFGRIHSDDDSAEPQNGSAGAQRPSLPGALLRIVPTQREAISNPSDMLREE